MSPCARRAEYTGTCLPASHVFCVPPTGYCGRCRPPLAGTPDLYLSVPHTAVFLFLCAMMPVQLLYRIAPSAHTSGLRGASDMPEQTFLCKQEMLVVSSKNEWHTYRVSETNSTIIQQDQVAMSAGGVASRMDRTPSVLHMGPAESQRHRRSSQEHNYMAVSIWA